MEIVFAKPADTNAVRSLWKICFGDTDAYMDAYFSSVYNPRYTLLAKVNGITVGALQMLPRPLCIHGETVKSAYIGGVSVLPAFRKNGIATALMGYAEDNLRQDGFLVSFLSPLRFAFYEKMGYSCSGFLSEFSGEIRALAPFTANDMRLRPVLGNPICAYTAFASQSALYMDRKLSFYQNEILPLSEDAKYISTEKDTGYMIYREHGDTLFVSELIYKDETALRNLLGFIYAQREHVSRFSIRTASRNTLRQFLCEGTITEKRFPHTMAKALSPICLPDSMDTYINMIGWF